MKLQPGQILRDRYEILTEMGEGGFGIVYQAKDIQLNREVVIKQLKLGTVESQSDIERFMRESKLLARLSHPGIVSVYSLEVLGEDSPCIVMESVRGIELKKFIAEKGGLPFNLCRRLFLQICDAVSYAHSEGVLHRDLSSSNVLICNGESDASSEARLIDFGLSKMMDSGTYNGGNAEHESGNKLTKTGVLLGKPAYMSPEACLGHVLEPRSDIYSLGCLLYEMITGHQPFEELESIGILYKQMREYPPRPEFAWESKDQENLFRSVCLYCLQKDIDKRPKSAQEIIALLTGDNEGGDIFLSLEGADKWSDDAVKKSPSTLMLSVICVGAFLLPVLFLGLRPAMELGSLDKKKAAIVLLSEDQKLVRMQERLKRKISKHGADSAELLKNHFELGEYLYNQSKYSDALPFLKKAHYLLRKYSTDPTARMLLDTERMTVNCLLANDNYAEAEKLASAILPEAEKRWGKNNEHYIYWLGKLGAICRMQGKPKQAALLSKERLQLAQQTDSHLFMETLQEVGQGDMADGDFGKAREHLSLSYAILKEEFVAQNSKLTINGSSDQSTFLEILMALASLSILEHKPKEAESFCMEGLELCKSGSGLVRKESWNLRFLETLVDCQLEEGKKAEAKKTSYKALKVFETSFSEPDTLEVRYELQQVFYRLNGTACYSEACPLAERALEIARKLTGEKSAETLVSTDELAVGYFFLGDYKKAERLFQKVSTFDTHAYPSESFRIKRVPEQLAACRARLNNQPALLKL